MASTHESHALRAHLIYPLEDRPIHHECVPRCHHEPWSRFLKEARATLSKRNAPAAPRLKERPANDTDRPRCPIDRIDARTRAFLDGHAPEGARNMSAFAASANLLGCGIDQHEAERLVAAGAAACGLPQREAMDAFKSALRAFTRKRMYT